jgi:hypothetical protein
MRRNGVKIVRLRTVSVFERPTHNMEDYSAQLRSLQANSEDCLLIALDYKRKLQADIALSAKAPDYWSHLRKSYLKDFLELVILVKNRIFELKINFSSGQYRAMVQKSHGIPQDDTQSTRNTERDGQQLQYTSVDGASSVANIRQQSSSEVLNLEYQPIPIYEESIVFPVADSHMPRHTLEPSSTYNRSTTMSQMSLFNSPASFMTADSPGSFMTTRSTYTSPELGMMGGTSPVMRIETIREYELTDASMSAPLKQLRDDYYNHLRRQNII